MPTLPCTPRTCKLFHQGGCKPQRIDDPQVSQRAFGTSLAEQVLGHIKPFRGFSRCGRAFIGLVESRRGADHRLTKLWIGEMHSPAAGTHQPSRARDWPAHLVRGHRSGTNLRAASSPTRNATPMEWPAKFDKIWSKLRHRTHRRKNQFTEAAAGRVTMNLEPRPSSDSTESSPPWR